MGEISKLSKEGLSLKEIIQDNETPQGRYFDLFIQFLILVSIVSFSMETLPDLMDDTRSVLRWVEIVTVSIFTVEYLVRILVTDSKSKFVFSFYGLVDLLAILPFYISVGIDLRSLRIFRFLRVIRTFKLLRYNKTRLLLDSGVLIW